MTASILKLSTSLVQTVVAIKEYPANLFEVWRAPGQILDDLTRVDTCKLETSPTLMSSGRKNL